MKPRLLDLFCCAGGAARGYADAGFEVVGVDIDPQPHYPFEFYQADALKWLEQGGHVSFDAIHASPPCQGYTTMNNRHSSSIPKLIPVVRDLLIATGLPYVIENVSGARFELREPVQLTGAQFGKRIHRPRLFETNWLLLGLPRAEQAKDVVAIYGKNDGRRLRTRSDGTELRVADLDTARAEMDMPWADWDEIREAIPPVFTKYIGEQLLAHIERRAA